MPRPATPSSRAGRPDPFSRFYAERTGRPALNRARRSAKSPGPAKSAGSKSRLATRGSSATRSEPVSGSMRRLAGSSPWAGRLHLSPLAASQSATKGRLETRGAFTIGYGMRSLRPARGSLLDAERLRRSRHAQELPRSHRFPTTPGFDRAPSVTMTHCSCGVGGDRWESHGRPTTAQLTTIPPWVPVMVDVTVSRARMTWVPAVLRVTLKVRTPALAAVKV